MEKYTLHNISNYILELLKQELPEIKWDEKVLGAVFPKETTGLIYCDSLEFQHTGKTISKAKAIYGIDIIGPNPKGEELKTRPVENIALRIREILTKDYSLGNWALYSSVDRIIFGAPAGMNTVGRALIMYTVEFEMEEI